MFPEIPAIFPKYLAVSPKYCEKILNILNIFLTVFYKYYKLIKNLIYWQDRNVSVSTK